MLGRKKNWRIKMTQYDLLGKPLKEEWEKEWEDMPEFVQEDKRPFKQIIVNFRNEEDVKDFSKVIGQKLTLSTKSISFPKMDKEKPQNYLYTYMDPKK